MSDLEVGNGRTRIERGFRTGGGIRDAACGGFDACDWKPDVVEKRKREGVEP